MIGNPPAAWTRTYHPSDRHRERVWTQRYGDLIMVRDMTTAHVENALQLLRVRRLMRSAIATDDRNTPAVIDEARCLCRGDEDWIATFEAELAWRAEHGASASPGPGKTRRWIDPFDQSAFRTPCGASD